MRQLDEGQIDELTGGGECHLHHHPTSITHVEVDQFQAILRIRQTALDYTANPVDDIIVCNTNVGNITVTLPLAQGAKEFTVTKASALNTVTIAFSGGQTCYGQATVTLSAIGEVKRFKAFFDNWITI